MRWQEQLNGFKDDKTMWQLFLANYRAFLDATVQTNVSRNRIFTDSLTYSLTALKLLERETG